MLYSDIQILEDERQTIYSKGGFLGNTPARVTREILEAQKLPRKDAYDYMLQHGADGR